MLKQSPSRNQRSKGFKVKHALQACLLLAIVIWLLYQVQRSHHKKLALEESSGQRSKNDRQGYGIFKFGRKDLNPRVEEAAAENLKRENGEVGAEDEESKHEENEDEGRGGGDDEIDGLDQDKGEEDESELLEDLIDEEDKEREEGTEGRESEQKEDPIDDIIGWNAEKAQEDAASDVVQYTHIISTENENGALRAMVEEEHDVKNVAKHELEMENTTYSIGEINQEDKIHSGNSFGSEENVGQFGLNILDDGSLFNSSLKSKSNEQEVSNNSVAAHLEIGERIANHSNMQAVEPEQNGYPNGTAKDEQSHLSATIPLTVNSDAAKTKLGVSYIESETAVQEGIVKLDAAAGTEDNSASISTTEMAGAVHSRDSNANTMAEETQEISELSTRNGTAETTQNELVDSSDSSLYQDNKEYHIALEALPETNLGENNSGNAIE